jgi:hypothetical protein
MKVIQKLMKMTMINYHLVHPILIIIIIIILMKIVIQFIKTLLPKILVLEDNLKEVKGKIKIIIINHY